MCGYNGPSNRTEKSITIEELRRLKLYKKTASDALAHYRKLGISLPIYASDESIVLMLQAYVGAVYFVTPQQINIVRGLLV